MRNFAFLLLALFALSFSSRAESIKHPAEYLFPEIPQIISQEHSLKEASLCQGITGVHNRMDGNAFIGNLDLEFDTDSHYYFWRRGVEAILRQPDKAQSAPLSSGEEAYLISLLTSPDQKAFTARDKLFIAENYGPEDVEDKKFIHSHYYADCHMRMSKVISKYKALMAAKPKEGFY